MEADVAKLQTQLEVWGAEIDRLAAAAGKAGAAARIDLHLHIDDLKVKRAIARARLDEFKAAEIGKRASLKPGLEGAWNDLEMSFRDPKRYPRSRGGSLSPSITEATRITTQLGR